MIPALIPALTKTKNKLTFIKFLRRKHSYLKGINPRSNLLINIGIIRWNANIIAIVTRVHITITSACIVTMLLQHIHITTQETTQIFISYNRTSAWWLQRRRVATLMTWTVRDNKTASANHRRSNSQSNSQLCIVTIYDSKLINSFTWCIY